MGNPNPFYRFKQGWNAGFYPDNQIVSDLLNEIRAEIVTQLPSLVTYGTTTINQLKTSIRNLVNVYNAYPYYGNFEVTMQTDLEPPNYYYYIYIKDNSLHNVDSSQLVQVVGIYDNSNNTVSSSSVSVFTPGAYSGSFAEPLINEEVRVSEALDVVNINGSAIFPITYSFNPISNVATSGLARGDNWFIDSNGNPDRQPVPNLPYENRRTFELPQLTGDDRFIISVMERLIQASLADTDYTNSILAEYNKYTMPDGWSKSISSPSFTTYQRVQAVFTDPNRRRFTLVGRLDGQWLWQRFVSDDATSSAYNFLSVYPENVALPFEPNQAGRWLYNDNTFDFEFVEFTSGCYVSPEFYAMPGKPGDQLQFSVTDGNLTGVDSVKIGLFKQDGEFIQGIGQAVKPVYCLCDYQWSYTYTSTQFNDLRLSINGNIITPPQIYYNGFYLYNSSELIYSLAKITPNDFLNDSNDLVNYLISFSNNQFIVGVVLDGEGNATVTLTKIDSIQCENNPFVVSFLYGIIPSNPETGPFEINQYSESKTECCSSINQFQGNVTIPALKGCYRMGLYNEPSTTCDLTLQYTLEWSALTDYLTEINTTIYESVQPYISFIIDGSGVYVYTVSSSSTNASDIATWCNANIPNMNASTGEGTLTWVVNLNDVPCGTTYGMSSCQSDIEGNNCFVELWTTGEQPCTCGTSYSLYSLSNIINIDASDCFSTILEYWGEDNSIAQGIEYFNNWKQKIRIGLNGGGEKPVIEESVYRQSNGVHRRPQNKQDLSLDLHTDFFDLETQLAMTDATRHPYIVWNGFGIFVKGDLDVATIQDFTTETSFETLSQMKFQVLKQGFQPKNSSCLNC